MVTDRTQYDVDEAKRIRAEKIQKEITPTTAEIAQLERGTLTINTLNRIEEKQEELKELINGLGYYNTPIVNKSWKHSDIFSQADFDRIVENDRILRNAFFVYSDTPNVPSAKLHFQNINDLEKILVDLDVMINDVKSYYAECGNTECGE